MSSTPEDPENFNEFGPNLGPEEMAGSENFEELDLSLNVDIDAPLPNTRDLTRDVMKTLNQTIGDAELPGSKLWQDDASPMKRLQAKTAAKVDETGEEAQLDTPKEQEDDLTIQADDTDTVKARKLREALGLGANATEQLPPHEEKRLGRDAVMAITLLSNYAKKYPIENTLVTETIESLLESIRPILAVYSNAMITVLNESIYVDDRQIHLDQYGEKVFIQEMLRRRIRRIVFRSEVKQEDIRELARLFTGRPDEMVARGGAAFIISEAGVDQIRIVESQFVTGSVNEADSTNLDKRLMEAGLETSEVLGAISGDPRSPRLISDELKLLYEALKAPGLLAVLLMRVAKETLSDPMAINPVKNRFHMYGKALDPPEGADLSYELIQMTKRLRYLLAMGSPIELDKASIVIRQGMDALPVDTRRNLLKYALWMRDKFHLELDNSLFDFRSDEYAELIYEFWKEDGQWPIDFHFFSSTEASHIAQALEARLLIAVEMNSDPAKVKILSEMVAERLQLPHQAYLDLQEELEAERKNDNPQPHTDPIRLVESKQEQNDFKIWPISSLQQALNSRLESFSSDLTEGYTHILILLMMATTRTNHTGKFAERLAIIIEARLTAGRFEDVMYLLAATRHENINLEKQEILRNKLEKIINSNTQLIPYFFSRLLMSDHAALEAMHLCTDISQNKFLEKVVQLAFNQNIHSAMEQSLLPSYLNRHAMHMIPILANMLHTGNATERAWVLTFLGYFEDDSVRDMAMLALNDKTSDVQVAAILGLRQTQSEDALTRLIAIAKGKIQIGGLEGRCAAIHVLGQKRHPELIAIAKAILGKPGRKKKDHELKTFALKALYDMRTADAFEVMKTMLREADLKPLESSQGLGSYLRGKLKR